MSIKTSTQLTKSLINIDTKVLTMLYEDLAKPGVQQVGKALSTVLGLGNTVLLPLKLLNEKTNYWFSSHMEVYRVRLAQVTPDQVVEVAPELGVPILEKLGKTTNPTLRDLYIRLLTTASLVDTVALAHPRFIPIIESITPDEARILDYMSKEESRLPYITVIVQPNLGPDDKKESQPIETLLSHKTVLEVSNHLTHPSNAPLYFSNLTGLGLLRIEDQRMIVMEHRYDALIGQFQEEAQRLGAQFAQKNNLREAGLTTKCGYYEFTEFGKSFLKACLLDDVATTS